jgi:hypothetical protein
MKYLFFWPSYHGHDNAAAAAEPWDHVDSCHKARESVSSLVPRAYIPRALTTTGGIKLKRGREFRGGGGG